MSAKYILNEHGEPARCDDLYAWSEWFEQSDAERRIARDEVGDDVKVSTVFLGLDHSFGNAAPMLFETMIFGGPHDDYQERYATRDEAVAGHARAVALASAPASSPTEPDEHTTNG